MTAVEKLAGTLTQVGTIHNDPPTPGSYHINSFQLTHLDHDAVEARQHVPLQPQHPTGLTSRLMIVCSLRV